MTHYFAKRNSLTLIDLSSAWEVALNLRQNKSKLVVTINAKQTNRKQTTTHKETTVDFETSVQVQ